MYNRRHVTHIHTNLAIKIGNNSISNKVNRYVIHVYIIEYYSAVKSNEWQLCTSPGINLTDSV